MRGSAATRCGTRDSRPAAARPRKREKHPEQTKCVNHTNRLDTIGSCEHNLACSPLVRPPFSRLLTVGWLCRRALPRCRLSQQSKPRAEVPRTLASKHLASLAVSRKSHHAKGGEQQAAGGRRLHVCTHVGGRWTVLARWPAGAPLERGSAGDTYDGDARRASPPRRARPHRWCSALLSAPFGQRG